MRRPIIVLLLGFAATLGCPDPTPPAWNVNVTQVDLIPDCRGVELDIRVYQDGVQKDQTSWSMLQDPPGQFNETGGSVSGVDFSRPLRIRVIAHVDGNCPPWVSGQILYFPSATGWGNTTPGPGGSHTADMGSFTLLFSRGTVTPP